MLGQLLATRSLVVVPVDEQRQVWEVLFLQGQRGREVMTRAVTRTPEEVLQRPNLKQMVFVTLPLQHINAQIATNALRPFFMSNQQVPTLQIGTAGTNEALIMTGFSDQIATCIQMLRVCDRPLEERNQDLNNALMTIQNLQGTVAELQTRMATAQKQIADLQKATAPK
jgi:hypothetical protein